MAEAVELEEESAVEGSSDLGSYLYDDVGPSPSLDYGVSDEDDGGGRERESKMLSSIEDFYARYPEMGRGEWKLRVVRTEPKAHRGQSIGGFVCDIFEKISQGEFSDRFGGGVYSVQLLRPTTDNEGTTADYKTVRELKFRVAGDPILRSDMPVHYDERSSKAATQFEVARLQADDRERHRLHEEKRRAEEKADRLQRELMPNFYNTTHKVVTDLSGMKDAQVEFWKAEAERARGEIKTIRDEAKAELASQEAALKKAQEDMIRLKQEATATTLQIESRVVSEQKGHYERIINDQKANFESRLSELREQSNNTQRELRERSDSQLKELRDRLYDENRRLVDEYNRKIHDMGESHKAQMADIVNRNDADRKALLESNMAERERLRSDSSERIVQLTTQKASEMLSLRETYESRIADLRSSTDRELASLRDATAREIESIRQSERAQTALARETAEIRKESVKQEEQRLRQELSDLRRENSDLRDRLDTERASKHKDLPTAIREAREMAGHLGLVDSSEVERPEVEQSTVGQFVGLARQAFDSAPQILDKIMQARKEQQDAVLQSQALQAQAQQMQAQQAMTMQQGRQMRQLPAPQGATPNRPPQAPSQPARAPQRYAPPGMPSQTQAGGVPFGGQPLMPPQAPVPFAPPPFVAASPVQPAQAGEAPVKHVEEPDEGPSTDGGAFASQQEEGISAEDGNMIVMFFKKLEVAIENRVVSPETFAIGVIDEIGIEQTANLLQQFSPADIVETAQQLSADTRIATRDGQKFVEELWRVGGERVRSAGL